MDKDALRGTNSLSRVMVSYDDALSLGPGIVGGKGWNLGRLHRYGFRVPNGGILNAELYRQFLKKPELHAISAELAKIRISALTESKVGDLLHTLRARIEATAFSPEVEHAIQTFLLDSGIAHLPLAVRSSATTEDSASFSFAGIHESFLNVEGTLQDVLQAIKGCYTSLWTPRALTYRRHYGLADDAVACAVVICTMVAGDENAPSGAAGVAFSCDPRTGQCDRITINAAPGRGEDVVTGTASPEAISVVPSPDSEPSRIERVKDQIQVLSDEQVSVLTSLIERIVWALGNGQEPQDVEWIYDGHSFWIVQARPVSHLPRLTFPQIANLPTIWSNGNLKDVIPGILTPLSWCILQPIVSTFLRAPCQAAGYSLPEGTEMMRRFNGRAYFNLTTLQWSYYDALGILPREVNQGLGGHQPEIPVPTQRPLRGREGPRRLRGRLRLLRAIGRNARTLPQDMLLIRKHAKLQTHQQLTDLTNAQLLEQLRLLHTQGTAFGLRFQFANMGGVWGDYLIQTLERERPGQGRSLSSALMAGTRRVVSAEHAYQLYEIALTAKNDAAAIAYLATNPRDPQGWRDLPEDSSFRLAFTSFLDTFGHRSIYEFELANSRWCEEPSYLLDCIQALLAQETLTIPYALPREKRQTAEAEVARLPLLPRLLVSWFARQARRTASHREEGKSTLVALLQPVREIAREIGKRMLTAHILEDRDDIFFLALPEIAAFLRGEWNGQGARALVADRKEQRHAWLSQTPVDVFIHDATDRSVALPSAQSVEAPVPTSEGETRSHRKSEILQGLGASPGQASGRARLISHPHEGQRLQAGEILVAPSTDPGWTPLFLRASAIVMETGGYLSHGAIVAREFGIPAVVNIAGLLKIVEEGQYLTVDGNQGRIILEDDGKK
jgi:phosphohistidine swiveling domain-containing protein